MGNLSKLLKPRLAELGKIKIGCKGETRQGGKAGTWRMPEKLDHFLVTGCGRDAKGDLKVDTKLMDRLVREHGDEDKSLRRIPILLLSDDIDEVMLASFCFYTGRRLAARCDGETVTYFAHGGKWLDSPISKPCSGEHEADGWKLHTTLSCVIAMGEASFGGVYKLRTTSRISADQLYGSLLHIQALTSGILQGVPLWLIVRPVEVSPEGKATTVHVVHIELRGENLSAIQQMALQSAQVRIQNERQLRSVRSEYLKLLRAPGVDEDEEEQADVAEEFDPGERQALPPAGESSAVVVEKPAVAVVAKPAEKPTTKPRGRVHIVDVDENGDPIEAAPEPAKPATVAPPIPPSGPRTVEPVEPTRAEPDEEPSAEALESLPF